MRSKSSKSLKRPPALKLGDTVAVIRPAGAVDPQKYRDVCQFLRQAGFFVAEYPGEFEKDHYFAASDEQRAREWIWAFSEPAIRAVLVARAGYGVMRTFAKIRPKDWKKFQSKIFVGYSDMSFAHQWMINQWSHLSFHGALVGYLGASEIQSLADQLIHLPQEVSKEKWEEVKVIQKGRAKGMLVGGNLSLLQSFGPSALPRRPLILALEDVNEDFYRIDRMIWSLIHAGYGKWVKALILGTFHRCGKDRDQFPKSKLIESFKTLCSGPIWWGAKFGHGLKTQRILGLGSLVEVREKELRYLHPLVSSR